MSWQRLLLINYLSLNHMETRKILPKEPYSARLGEDFYFSENVNKKWIDVVFDHEKNNFKVRDTSYGGRDDTFKTLKEAEDFLNAKIAKDYTSSP